MRKTRFIPLILSVCMIFGMLTATAFSVSAAEASEAVSANQTVINVTNDNISSYGAAKAIQSALNEAKDNATANNVYKVVVAKGSYVIGTSLKIYSNTYLSLKDVTLIRDKYSEINIIRTGATDDANTGVTGYNAYTNITIDGGTLDGNATSNTMVKLAHATDVTVCNMKLSNVKDGHIMEVAGVDGFTVRNCDFSDQLLSKSTIGYEAIQLDILCQAHFVGYRSEDLPMKNVLIEDCNFKNCPRGVGSHTAILNRPFDGITIRNCDFSDMGSVAIQGMNWSNCEITGNTVDNSPRGIAVYSVMGEGAGTYTSGAIAKEGNTVAHAPSGYVAPSNTVISDNILNKIGNVKDVYASYECLGIAAIGYNIQEVYKKESDGSGGLPKGDYYISGVNISRNIIDTRGHGVRLSDTKSTAVSNNIITCSENTFSSARFHGIFVLEGTADSITDNEIANASVNGIYVYNGSNASLISGNAVSNAKNYGISIDNAKAGTISSNTVYKSASNGIHASNGAKVTGNITGNSVSYAGNHGISITANSSAGKIYSNNVYGSEVKNINVNPNSTATVGENFNTVTEISSITLSKKSLTLTVGETYTLTKALSPSGVRSTFVWSSNNTSILSVDNSGRITAKAVGTAIITVKSANGKAATCTVTVKKPEVVTPPEETDKLIGDINDDGAVDINDATYIQMYLAGYEDCPIDKSDSAQLEIADLNKDSKIDINDVTAIQMILAGYDL